MADVCWGDAKYLVLHFENGKLVGTKVCHSWRGAQMSKRNFEKLLDGYDGGSRTPRALVKILPIEGILRMRGLECCGDFSAEDEAELRKMGISA